MSTPKATSQADRYRILTVLRLWLKLAEFMFLQIVVDSRGAAGPRVLQSATDIIVLLTAI